MSHTLVELLFGVAALCAAGIVTIVTTWPRGVRSEPGSFGRLFQEESRRAGARPFRVERRPMVAPGANLTDEQLIWSAVAIDSLDSPIEAWEQWHSIDPHVFEAFQQMTHQPIENLADLTRVVDLKNYDVHNGDFLQSVKGHVGEWHVNADMLALHPVMAPDSNFAGTDLWVSGGHALNVKTVADASAHLPSHFADHPDVAAVLPYDAHHIPPDALYYHPGAQIDPSFFGQEHATIVDTHLSNADVYAQTHHAFDAVVHPAGGFYMPWVTLAMTGFVEGRLLVRGETDVVRAAATTGGTVAAVGIFALLGKIVGGIAGTAVAPGAGTIGGAVTGGVAGSFLGKKIVNFFKKWRVDQAVEAFRLAQATYARRAAEASAHVQEGWQNGEHAIQEALGNDIAALASSSESRLAALAASAATVDEMSTEDARRHARAACSIVGSRARRTARWSRTPLIASLVRERVRELAAWREELDALLGAWLGTPGEIAKLFDLLMVVPGGFKMARRYVRAYFAFKHRIYEKASRAVSGSFRTVVSERASAVQQLRDLWKQLDTEASARMRPSRLVLRDSADTLRRELRAIGGAGSPVVGSLDALLALPPP